MVSAHATDTEYGRGSALHPWRLPCCRSTERRDRVAALLQQRLALSGSGPLRRRRSLQGGRPSVRRRTRRRPWKRIWCDMRGSTPSRRSGTASPRVTATPTASCAASPSRRIGTTRCRTFATTYRGKGSGSRPLCSSRRVALSVACAAALRRGCRISRGGARPSERPTQMSRSKALREGSETNQSPRNAPCSRAADICDSLRRTEHRSGRGRADVTRVSGFRP